ncbi:hypothetical protein GQ43DRAFT_200015 [Delitschia confertaspora ATCC 74209]|uniref:Zn(2)-C6 fungal-type domain-containing protein n=1 Tax=Delitschia confertaspora ATCC 74209 TaxID=1513339 RepID=A0A9P4MLV9_9PLEO|nr:hypothetical protein GQ43DRAFT_200015 [Delitschia confertaspora ATCC 74209]
MVAEHQKRKRPAAACSQCYQKKQKCDRQYPCTNCTRRRLPELCTYTFSEFERKTKKCPLPSQETNQPISREGSHLQVPVKSIPQNGTSERDPNPDEHSSMANLRDTRSISAMISCLGYFEGSKSNLFGLMNKFDFLSLQEAPCEHTQSALSSALPEIRQCLDILPKRPIINCLIQHFFKEVNWISELLHPPLFLKCYEQWWKTFPGSSVHNLEFGVLILRMCAFSAQFIPSQSFGEDRIQNIPVDTIRIHCKNVARRLHRVTDQIRGGGSLTSVHHMFYWSCYLQNEGSMTDAWYALGDCIRVSREIGLHLTGGLDLKTPVNELERDISRRCFWNLFTCDRLLSLALDRAPWIQEDVSSLSFPQMRITSGAAVPSQGQPDAFAERLLEAKLAKLWADAHTQGTLRRDYYDICAVEEFQENICKSYIPSLPSAFSLHNEDTQWDSELPMLPRQRQMLRISIYASMCHLFQPMLQLDEERISSLPQYKKNLLVLQNVRLVQSAICLLDGVFALYDLLGRQRMSMFSLGFFSYQAAVLLSMNVIWAASAGKTLRPGSRKPHEVLHSTEFVYEKASEDQPRDHNAGYLRGYIDKALVLLRDLGDANQIAKLGMQHLEKIVVRVDSIISSIAPKESHSLVSSNLDGGGSERESHDWLGFELAPGGDENASMESSGITMSLSRDSSTPSPNMQSPVPTTSTCELNSATAYSDITLDSALGGSGFPNMDFMASFPMEIERGLNQWPEFRKREVGPAFPQHYGDEQHQDSRFFETTDNWTN